MSHRARAMLLLLPWPVVSTVAQGQDDAPEEVATLNGIIRAHDDIERAGNRIPPAFLPDGEGGDR